MADNPLTPEEMKSLFGDDAGTSSGAAVPAPAQAAPAAPILTPEQEKALFGDTGSSPAPAAPGPATEMVAPSDALESFQAGTLSGMGDVAGGIQRLFGYPATLSDLTQNKLTAEQKAGMVVHPWAAGGGRILGQTAATLPATLATAYAMPEVGPMAAAPLIARGGYIGALTGAENALLTSGQNPNEPLPERTLRGAYWGIPSGMLGGWGENAAGAGQTIPPNVQSAGQRMQSAGIDVEPGNLPRTETSPSAQGGPPNRAQAPQINQAYGNIFGEDTPDFSPGNIAATRLKLGGAVGDAVRNGMIDYDVPLTSSATSPGQTFEQRLAEIEADSVGKPQIKRIISGPQGILSKVDTNGNIPGDAVGDLLQHNSWLDRATNSQSPEISGPADDIESAIHDAFGQSSTPGQAQAYSLARERYKLALAGEKAADPVTGNLDPSRLLTVVGQMYPDAKRLGPGASMSDQAVQFARDAKQIYGGSESAAPTLKPGGWLVPGAAATAGLGLEIAPHVLPWALPAALSNPLVAAGLISLPIARRLGLNLLQNYQDTPSFAANLLTRGSQRGAPYLAAPAGAAGSALSNQQW